MKRKIEVFDYAKEIIKAVEKGVLLTTKSKGRVNTMTISWGTLGIEWNKPIFTAFIREGRFTKELLDESGEFTINIFLNVLNRKIIGISGTRSGRNTDKIKDLKLTLVDSEMVNVPAIKELPLTLECKVIYKQKQDENAIPEEIKEKNYPKDVPGDFYGANRDYHTAYYGEIVSAYIIEED
ncbi:flavin reductase family protein [Parvimonas sp. G1641]|uniref:flavin reductase family protein n=1 Tax=Parvimonas sp. G1641 TaxID=3388846 RepID=UPI00397F7D11